MLLLSTGRQQQYMSCSCGERALAPKASTGGGFADAEWLMCGLLLAAGCLAAAYYQWWPA
jgi:hypothetical protein